MRHAVALARPISGLAGGVGVSPRRRALVAFAGFAQVVPAHQRRAGDRAIPTGTVAAPAQEEHSTAARVRTECEASALEVSILGGPSHDVSIVEIAVPDELLIRSS